MKKPHPPVPAPAPSFHKISGPPSGGLQTTATALLEGLVSLVYPACCLGCGNRVASHTAPLCPGCLTRLERPSPEEVAEQLAGLPPEAQVLGQIFALWRFDKGGTLQRVQHALKYGNRPAYGPALGRLIGQVISGSEPFPLDGVVPVPLHPRRRLERGYNQSDWLAGGVAASLAVSYEGGMLLRSHATRSQTRLSRRERWMNVADAFFVARPSAVAGRHLLLVDDVLTTGATAAAAARVLRAAGGATVHLATLGLAR